MKWQSKGADLALLSGIIESSYAIKYTADTVKNHAQKAKSAISRLTASPYHKAMETLSDFKESL